METTYSQARAKLAQLCDAAVNDREIVRITRRNAPAVVLIAEDELAGLMETAHLLRSPKNAERLLQAIARARAGEGQAMTVDELRGEVGLG